MKRSTPRLLKSGTGWSKRESLIIPKNLPDEVLNGEEKSFRVSLNGELEPLEEVEGEDLVTSQPSVEVHFQPSNAAAEEANLLPIYEVVVNPEAGCDQVQLLGAGSCVDDEALLCLTDPQEEQGESIVGFQEFNEPCTATTSELCRICACASQDLIPIFSIEGEHLQLAGKIIRHLPITVCENDRLPLHVCETCVAQINMCHELVRICGEADIRLRLMLDQEDRLKDNQAMSVLNTPKPEEVNNEESITLDETNTPWNCTESQQQTVTVEVDSESQLPELCPTKAQQSQISQAVIQDGKKSKFKVVVVKLSNSSNTMTKEEQIAKALAMIKSGDQVKHHSSMKIDQLVGEDQRGNWEGEGFPSDREQWIDHPFLCSLCNVTKVGVESFMQHQRDVHDLQLYHCNLCNTFYDSEEQLQQHCSEQHLTQSNDNVKITNVAEIQLLNSNKLTLNSNMCMKVSKDFDKMDKSLRSKIVGAIQDIVLQDQSIKYQCEVCKDSFSSKESLNKHCKELQHKISRPINCSLCKQTFKNFSKLQEHKQSSHDDLKSFICNYCEMKFLTKRMLLRHISEHAEYKAFTCNTCGKGYNSKTGFEIHLSTHNTEKPYLCDLCGKSFKHVSNLKGHKRSHLSEEDKKRQGCPFCEKKFRCKFLVEEHMRMHTGERPFSCDICNKKFYKRQQLKQHKLVHSNYSYECHICGSRFNRRGNMTEHIKKHMTTRRYTCKVCKEGFETISQVVAHRKTHTNEEVAQSKMLFDENNDKDSALSNFQCQICNKMLATRLSLVSHMRIHTGEKPFECEFCGQRFAQKPALTYHRRRHTGEKPFPCTYCNEGFLSRNAKNIHERIHTGEKPYSCYVCGMSFRCASSLTQHLMVHSDQRPFSCPHCNKCFRRREAMQVHLRIHTGEKPYACDVCGRAFTQRGDMVKHRRTHANDKPHRCKHCDFISTSRKELKKHEALHQIDSESILIASENLITSFPEITIVGQDCEMILGDGQDMEDEIN